MPLTQHRQQGNLEEPSEPSGKTARRPGKLFVVQKHAARSLRYDFRLELDGVLKSWSVPKGPSLDPANRRLAVEVEDRPLDCAFFEGVPKRELGGSVLVWDRGRWQPEGDPHTGLRHGKLVFELAGLRLHGRWALVRLERSRNGKQNWLLMKLADPAMKRHGARLERPPASIASERDLPALARAKSRAASASSDRLRTPAPRRRKR